MHNHNVNLPNFADLILLNFSVILFSVFIIIFCASESINTNRNMKQILVLKTLHFLHGIVPLPVCLFKYPVIFNMHFLLSFINYTK
ncbi:hypothetical protein PRIPAC_83235 [Pristionchus pacificus]|nr:hypothetical protein PRIPAC_83235 [Pristionchus pacificus]